jgi:hypothetical protein
MSGVFISYRREDSSAYAGRLFDILSAHFGKENTYMDLDTIRGGDDFAAVIEEKISLCDVLLAVIGERWLTATGEHGSRRLDLTGDFVRLEIAKALERGVRVIPVLVGGATIPDPGALPDDLRPLSIHQAMDLRDAHFHADAERLIDVLDGIVPSTANRRWTSNRFVPAVSSAVAVAAVVSGILWFRPVRPVVHENPDSADQAQTASASSSVRPAQANSVEADRSTKLTSAPADVAGKWKATIKYDWGAVYAETFDFEVDGPELSGTASFLETDRGIFDGKIEGSRISFMTRSQTAVGDVTYDDKHYNKVTVEGDAIRFSMLTDSGSASHVPVHFTAKKSRAHQG